MSLIGTFTEIDPQGKLEVDVLEGKAVATAQLVGKLDVQIPGLVGEIDVDEVAGTLEQT